ncbi:2-oxo-4-hydroxy-4-carboxy-5-ureidoimidazoline decarboxylase [Bacillaceae bacterium Marseille-Q3522]|nr:2-oxo-4-hydroxy-4-carboxy-5-ureidoimidazoline decarboxylase [Bacillaceae bacterium Marseille-Q3522]
MKLAELNQYNKAAFINALGEIFEHSSWIAEKAAAYRPFSSIEVLQQTMIEIVRNAPDEDQLALIRAHPNLGYKIEMSPDSTKEQQGAGLQSLTKEEYENFRLLNEQYMNKFGFPFIFAVKGKTKDDIYEAMTKRVVNTYKEEFATALAEIYKIARFRLQDKVEYEPE